MSEAINLNDGNVLVDMIEKDGRVNMKALRSYFNIPTGKKGNTQLVKNPFYVKGSTGKPENQFKYIVSQINKKIRNQGRETVISFLRGAPRQEVTEEVSLDIDERLDDPQSIEVIMEDLEKIEPVPEALPANTKLEQLVEEILQGRLDIDELLDDPRSIEEIIEELEKIELEPEPEPEPEARPEAEPEPLPEALPARSKPLASEEGFTIQGLKRNLIETTTGAKYMGSGTPLVKFLKEGVKPVGEVDRISMEHDIRYSTATSQKDVQDADRLFIERLNDVASRKSSIGDIMLSLVAAPAMTLKTFLAKIPYSPVDAAFVDYEENANRPERQALLAIQNQLSKKPEVTERAIDFIFQKGVQQALKQTPSEEDVSAREEEVLEEMVLDEDEHKSSDAPPLSPEPRVVPSFRKGHDDRVKQEQMLQRLQKEEEDRRMGLIYENNPDDYMANPVPNYYARPMFPNEWLDIQKLQQYQTPEYVKDEKEIWERNWQTPFQYGEGTPDNSVKDIQNIVERLARLEHHLRYDLASKGLPRDQVNVAVRYGEPMRRTGRVPTSHHERYDVYKKMSKDMSAYQYEQRQNEPPRTKLINREMQQFKPTRELQGQQKVYDELMTEGLPKLDIDNEYDRIYYERRIRKR